MATMTQDDALYTRLIEDPALAALVGTYQAEPSIFLDPSVPEDAQRPYVLVLEPLADLPWEGKLHRGREIRRDIWCVDDREHSWIKVKAIALRVRELLHRKPLSLDAPTIEIRGVTAEVSGPEALPSDESVASLRLTFTQRERQTIITA